jgi:hypothetical protein
MNPKCYKSVILAPICLLILTERLKILQQTVQITACCNIGSGLVVRQTGLAW